MVSDEKLINFRYRYNRVEEARNFNNVFARFEN